MPPIEEVELNRNAIGTVPALLFCESPIKYKWKRAGDVANVVVDDDVQELASVDEAGSLKYLVIVPLRVCVRERGVWPVSELCGLSICHTLVCLWPPHQWPVDPLRTAYQHGSCWK